MVIGLYGYNYITSHTYASDYTVVTFYGRNGYVPRGVVPNVYGQKLDGMLYMSKALN
jgi:hypothetical protein